MATTPPADYGSWISTEYCWLGGGEKAMILAPAAG